MKSIRMPWVLGFLSVLIYLTAPKAFGQQRVVVPATNPSSDDEELISLQFPPNLELKVLIQYVGTRLGVNFIYDEQCPKARVEQCRHAGILKNLAIAIGPR